jgi:outer membrane lipoprotein-sorting protein
VNLVNLLRRLSLSRLLLLCGALTALGAALAAIALAVSAGPVPAAKPLAQAIHDALAAPAVEGVEANIKLTDHLLEGAELASGGGGEAGQLASSPLISGASGRLWISKDGRVRLELQAEKGDTQIIYDGKTITLYDAATNTLYRYAPPAHEGTAATPTDGHREPPSVSKIEEAISHAEQHAKLSGATPTDVAGQAAYTLRISPKESGSLIGGGELSWDAVHGVPLRAAVYSSDSTAPVIELAATKISYGRVPASVFEFTPPADAKVHKLGAATTGAARTDAGARDRVRARIHARRAARSGAHTKITTHGHGVMSIAVIETHPRTAGNGSSGSSSSLPSSLPKVKIGATSATELATALGTVLSFERAGVRYLVIGALAPASLEAFARGL